MTTRTNLPDFIDYATVHAHEGSGKVWPRGRIGKTPDGKTVLYRDVSDKVLLFNNWCLEAAIVGRLKDEGVTEIHYRHEKTNVLYTILVDDVLNLTDPRSVQKRNGRIQYLIPLRLWEVKEPYYEAPAAGRRAPRRIEIDV